MEKGEGIRKKKKGGRKETGWSGLGSDLTGSSTRSTLWRWTKREIIVDGSDVVVCLQADAISS